MALAISAMEQYSDLQKELILLVNIDNIPIESTFKLQKIVFALSRLTRKIKEHGFKPSIYGPHSILVENELQNMIQQGILSMDGEKISTTPKGKEIFNDIIKETSIKVITDWDAYFDFGFNTLDKEKDFREKLSYYKDIINDVTRDEVLSYIYCNVPDMISDRTEYERLKPHFEEHIISMLKKDKFGAGRAANLLGQSLEDMMDKGLYKPYRARRTQDLEL